MTVKLRYKEPDGETSRLLAVAVKDGAQADSADVRFAAAVVAFGMLLRESEHKGTATYAAVLELARQGRGEDRDGYRTEFIQLIESARALAESETSRVGS
jgi:Ca-activated chloride channel family protein